MQSLKDKMEVRHCAKALIAVLFVLRTPHQVPMRWGCNLLDVAVLISLAGSAYYTGTASAKERKQQRLVQSLETGWL